MGFLEGVFGGRMGQPEQKETGENGEILRRRKRRWSFESVGIAQGLSCLAKREHQSGRDPPESICTVEGGREGLARGDWTGAEVLCWSLAKREKVTKAGHSLRRRRLSVRRWFPCRRVFLFVCVWYVIAACASSSSEASGLEVVEGKGKESKIVVT
ncbi:hypothetical protein R1sor_013181 [Riccia sorocarpa]|uniref:Uncharacterized protein n=1 Tax=Riccia sorocarpa TaxID=122646 RepID=A0ABD3H8H3_9MARC